MCGITGFVNFKKNIKEENKILKDMTDTLVNRGPNAEGMYISNNVMLGHRRLIVVDPEGGGQPMKRLLMERNMYLYIMESYIILKI